jgi:hypothetical protein
MDADKITRLRNERYFVRRFPFPILIIGAVFLFGWIVMLLWNAILPQVTSVKELSYWQAVGLLVLSRILVGGFGRGPGGWRRHRPPFGMGANWREKWDQMNDEERKQFVTEWKRKCDALRREV